MRAIILAAGMGTRLGKYTEKLPKGMLKFNNRPLIEWQIKQLRKAGVENISIITGYMNQEINFDGISYYHNPDYATTNMVESLMCAREKMDSDVVVAYGDIIYTSELATLVCESGDDIGVAVDKSWRSYWKIRYGTTETDLESLTVSGDTIVELGVPLENSEGIDYRYIGLIRFSAAGIKRALDIYDNKKAKNEQWAQSGNEFQQGYMTDLLNEMIEEGHNVAPIVSEGGWIEFDTVEDYEVMLTEFNNGAIPKSFF